MIDLMRRRRIQALMLIVPLAMAAGLSWTTSALGIGVGEIPSPRPAEWTVDLTGRFSVDTIKAFNSLGEEVKKQTGDELVTVIIDSTDGVDPHHFATDLYNRWRIGQPGRNNGLLLFAALDDRKAEIILGDDIDEQTRIDASRKIMQEIIVPRFKAGDASGAMYQGARACAEQILNVKLDPLQAEAAEPNAEKPAETAAAPAKVQPPQPPQPALPVGIGQPMIAAPPRRPSPSSFLAWLSGGVVGVGAAFFGARKFLRYHTRRCPACRGTMTRLGEVADDEFLSQGERIEEQVGSVDYDVWACGACRKTVKVRYGALFSRFSRCPQCRAKTKSTTKRTIRAATYTQGGLVVVEEVCRNCTYRNSRTHSTPALTDTTAASASAWSTASAAGASSPSTSVDSGVSGGHSSGGGASGSW